MKKLTKEEKKKMMMNASKNGLLLDQYLINLVKKMNEGKGKDGFQEGRRRGSEDAM